MFVLLCSILLLAVYLPLQYTNNEHCTNSAIRKGILKVHTSLTPFVLRLEVTCPYIVDFHPVILQLVSKVNIQTF